MEVRRSAARDSTFIAVSPYVLVVTGLYFRDVFWTGQYPAINFSWKVYLMGRMEGQRHTAGGRRKTQGIAYVLAMGWLGVGTRRGAGRRSGGDRKKTTGRPAGWF